jgi:hypothetical protein
MGQSSPLIAFLPLREEAHASRCKPPEPRKNGLPCKVRRAHGLIHRRSAAEEALSVLCSGLVTGSAPGHAHTALDGAQSSLAALNGLGQGGAQRPVALEENCRADLGFVSSRAREPGQHPVDTLLH